MEVIVQRHKLKPVFRNKNFMSDDPIKRYALLVLFQAQQDHATELVIGAGECDGPPIKYKVDDIWYDMSQPPAEILAAVVEEVQRLAALADGAFPREGAVDVAFSGVRLAWKVQIASLGAACVLTPIAV
jgi:hypothetical protein